MPSHLLADSRNAIPLIPVAAGKLDEAVAKLDAVGKRWVEATGFKAEAGETAIVPGADGSLGRVLVGVAPEERIWAYAGLPGKLPKGSYRIEAALGRDAATAAALGWALGCYSFDRYRKPANRFADLVWPEEADRGEVERLAQGMALARDLINTPAEDMGPAELAAAAGDVAHKAGAAFSVIEGDALLRENYPTIHAVGRGSARAPRLIDITWGDPSAPKVTLVGKGVCFDSGGLDLKPSSGMRLMKKDMGGAAVVLGLASAIMDAKLPVRLRVLVPAVENFVSSTSFRPLDVIKTRKGITVEVGNTDAEGRLILCDALAEADSEKPQLLIDCATLTGAARVALGPDIPALFVNDDALAADLLRASETETDPLWRLPLWQPYRKMFKSPVADINNVSESPFAGSIVAALYLEGFIAKTTPWAHIDMMAWNGSSRPGRPEGGEANSLRALYAMIKAKFGQ